MQNRLVLGFFAPGENIAGNFPFIYIALEQKYPEVINHVSILLAATCNICFYNSCHEVF